jgi:hypothetical protein
VSEQDITSRSASTHDIIAAWFAGWLCIICSAGLGFIVTFLAIGHEIASLKNELLPLLVFLPAYLLLISLTIVWVARRAARVERPVWTKPNSAFARRVSVMGMTVAGLALGIVAAVWYVHAVAK